jgi:hypothetical protein
VNFCLPRATFDAIAEDVDVPPIGDLNYKPGTGVADGTIANLGRSLLVAFGLPYQADRLFADHVTLAIGVHVAQTYGGLRPISRPVRGGLALWQIRRAKELLSANPDGAITLKEKAQECRLSVSHSLAASVKQGALRRISGCNRSESIQPKIILGGASVVAAMRRCRLGKSMSLAG